MYPRFNFLVVFGYNKTYYCTKLQIICLLLGSLDSSKQRSGIIKFKQLAVHINKVISEFVGGNNLNKQISN